MPNSLDKDNLCVYQSCDSIKDYLKSFKISGAKIKNSDLSKKFLEKNCKKGMQVSIPQNLLNNLQVNPEYNGQNINIVFEDELIIALSKPSGVHCHPLSYDETDNCLSFLRKSGKGKEVLCINKQSYDRGLLYRIDFLTSGLVIFSKNKEFLQYYRSNFNRHKKYYLAIVEGEIGNDFSFKHFIDYHGKKGNFAKIDTSKDANANIEGKKIAYCEKQNRSLVVVRLYEGLRHQIRAQLAYENTPIMGDPLYGIPDSNSPLFLHAYKYCFEFQDKGYEIIDPNIKSFEVIFDLDGGLQMINQALGRFD